MENKIIIIGAGGAGAQHTLHHIRHHINNDVALLIIGEHKKIEHPFTEPEPLIYRSQNRDKPAQIFENSNTEKFYKGRKRNNRKKVKRKKAFNGNRKKK